MARLTLGLVGLFVFAVVGTLVAKSRGTPSDPLAALPTAGDLRIRDAEIEEESGGVRWRLRAAQATYFQDARRAILRRVHVQVFERERAWTIVGEEGTFDDRAKAIELRGGVVVTSSDGARLETSLLRWQGRERRLWTDQPVRLTRQGAVAQGSGLDVNLRDEVTALTGRVHAVFVKEPRR